MDVDEGSVKSYKPVQESLVLNAYASSESLKREDVRDVDEGSGQKFRVWYKSHMRVARAQASVHIHALNGT